MMKTYYVEGLDCAVCSKKIENHLNKHPNVKECSINFLNKTLTIDTELSKSELQKEVRLIEDVKLEAINQGEKTDVFAIVKLAISALFLVIGLIIEEIQIASYICFGISFVLAAYDIFYKAIKKGFKGDFFDENLLMIIASVSAICIGLYSEAIAVVLLYGIGEVFIDTAVTGAKKKISALIASDMKYAFIKKDDKILEILAEDIIVGDTLVCKSGNKIAADGILQSDYALLDMKSLTGEAKLVRKEKGALLLSGSVVIDNPIEVLVTKKASESALASILALVEKASDLKAKSEKFLTKFARIYTPIVTLLALFIALVVPAFNGYVDFVKYLQIAIIFLVVSCPCALVISIPLAYFVAIGSLSKAGILVKGSCYLDSVLTTKTVLFDKTATLTTGDYKIIDIVSYIDKDLFLKLTSSVENYSKHPTGIIIANNYSEKEVATNVKEHKGLGIEGLVLGYNVKLGNKKFIPNDEVIEKDASIVYVSVDGEFAGYYLIGDELKREAKETLNYLINDQKYRAVVISGDSQKTVDAVSDSLGITERYGDLLPEDKYAYASKLREKNEPFLYLGDGVNDTPTLALADVAISFGQMGADSAIEVSNIILVDDSLSKLKTLIQKAKKTRRIVWVNVIFSLAIKFSVMGLALVGFSNIWAAVFADVGVAIIAILNSIRLR